MSKFKPGEIDGIIIKDLVRYDDGRGWLIELFRRDMISEDLFPEMSYVSLTYPGVARGPHEHVEQTDYFCFAGPSTFRLVLWDNRIGSETYNNMMSLDVGENDLKIVIVPPGVVHAYKNIGDKPGLVINLPNKLYAGRGRKEKVDEIRYEGDPDSPFRVD